ncbi:hypothetical protein RND81_07G039400 [Saponaria officinalis]|uniref:Uncharacterized protein n=1 Tax=Saponaria officinalis TaxID=3572 RepID=A0AAW1JNH6_SAPOF
MNINPKTQSPSSPHSYKPHNNNTTTIITLAFKFELQFFHNKFRDMFIYKTHCWTPTNYPQTTKMATFRKHVLNNNPNQHRHRRTTLATLLQSSMTRRGISNEPRTRGRTLMDLLSSSSILDMKNEDEEEGDDDDDELYVVCSAVKESKSGGNRKGRRVVSSKVGGSPGVRYRFVKRPWRPMLVAIPEGKLMEHY